MKRVSGQQYSKWPMRSRQIIWRGLIGHREYCCLIIKNVLENISRKNNLVSHCSQWCAFCWPYTVLGAWPFAGLVPVYYRLEIYRSYTWRDSAYSTTITVIKLWLDLHSWTTPHMSPLHIFLELYKEQWPWYIKSTLIITSVLKGLMIA